MRVTELSPSFFVLRCGAEGVLCAELFLVAKFVHEMGVLCAELLSVKKFVHRRGLWCTKLRTPEG